MQDAVATCYIASTRAGTYRVVLNKKFERDPGYAGGGWFKKTVGLESRFLKFWIISVASATKSLLKALLLGRWASFVPFADRKMQRKYDSKMQWRGWGWGYQHQYDNVRIGRQRLFVVIGVPVRVVATFGHGLAIVSKIQNFEVWKVQFQHPRVRQGVAACGGKTEAVRDGVSNTSDTDHNFGWELNKVVAFLWDSEEIRFTALQWSASSSPHELLSLSLPPPHHSTMGLWDSTLGFYSG